MDERKTKRKARAVSQRGQLNIWMDKEVLEKAYQQYLKDFQVEIGKGKFLEILCHSFLNNNN